MTRWVLLRGLTREARHWDALPQRLALELDGASVLTPDLPGNGSRHDERSPGTVAGHVAACRAALHAAGHAPPYVLLGLSLGGMVAMAWAAHHPDEVCGLVLVNSSARGTGPWHRRLRLRAWPGLARAVLARKPVVRERAVLALTARHPAAPRETLVADWARWHAERPVSSANALRQLVASARFRLPHPAPAVPALVMTSGGDGLVDPGCSRALADAWNAPLARHPTAGHDLPLDDPAWVAGTIGAWWRSVG
jgi:pimeloyl-ACP methyl ester carboxylesterase